MRESASLSNSDSWKDVRYVHLKYELFQIYRSKKEIYADLDLIEMELYELEH